MTRTFRIATRQSKLALTQTQQVIDAIKTHVPDFQYELVKITSDGDEEKNPGDLKKIGGKGLFIKALEQAILDEKADFAVHSMKDVPTDEELPKGLIIPAAMQRADRRDVAVCRKDFIDFSALTKGCVVGTSSPRREAQIKAFFPDLTVKPIRGNIDTRLKKLDRGDFDAILLAKAGMDRVNLNARITDVFEPDMIMPALGQGTVGMECRDDDKETINLLAKINHKNTFTCLSAERAMLNTLGGDCFTPVAGYCEVTKGGHLRFIAMVISADGQTVFRARHKMSYTQAEKLGKAVAKDLLSQGAADIIKQASAA